MGRNLPWYSDLPCTIEAEYTNVCGSHTGSPGLFTAGPCAVVFFLASPFSTCESDFKEEEDEGWRVTHVIHQEQEVAHSRVRVAGEKTAAAHVQEHSE